MNGIAVLIAVFLAGLFCLRWAIHRGFRIVGEMPTATPADFALPYRQLQVVTANGKILFAWMIAADSAGPAPAIVLMHGWGANAATLLPLAAPLHRAGLSVLLLDARNHGQSDADSFSSMPRFAEDIEAGLDWLKHQPDIDAGRLGLIGHSVGGAAALLVGSRRNDVAAIVSLSAFDHPERVMRQTLARAHIPYRPFGWLICRYVERVIGHRFDHIAPVNTIGKIHCPVLIGHGADDTLVPCAAARAIHARANPPTELHILADSTHEGPADLQGLGEELARFIAPILRR
ncbi:alpha/beta hydrolase [Magnetospirillum sulfuroxidans]|uniref:Alpha/beta fold hydrolase n=1 Tax=Magnetospirillum sulfuroxidans TaxID=611300 RepID=A0ABS5I7C7_9PROT|nr:alpha/beta fold hydrolase [Magnetospirillum sulfuroxidans]MBR9970305.1 alpha/beta fold hydrolase [Magnetospirillum sulfuroxidans]